MEEMASLWSYKVSVDELKQNLLWTTFDLESVRAEANEELKKNREYIKQLLQLLKIVFQERDEARDQLQKLLNKLMASNSPSDPFITLSQPQSESPLLKPTRTNSIITESSSHSETFNYQSHSSSPAADSFFDNLSSSELSNINMGDFVSKHLVQNCNETLPTSLMSSGTPPKIDQGSLVINNLIKGKTLPQKGKLFHAVLETGPLLQTLLVAGPLPRWRNPPPLETFQIPPVSIKGCSNTESVVVTQDSAANSSNVVPRSLYSSQSHVQMSCRQWA